MVSLKGCEYSWILHQNSSSLFFFLKKRCTMESDILSMKFLFSVTLKSPELFYILNGSPTCVRFCVKMFWSFGKYWLSYADVLQADIFQYLISKTSHL